MCGITGFYSFQKAGHELSDSLRRATVNLAKRGPDHQSHTIQGNVGLGHTRLSILDTSELAHQPMTDATGRYTLIFNGEIYNYRELKKSLPDVSLKSSGDTEVLLHLLIKEGAHCLPKLNGFFVFAFYDKKEKSLLLARDQMGIKPLHYFSSEEFFAFGSEMKALMEFPFAREIDQNSLYWYLKLNYLPGTMSMPKGVKKLPPGHFMKLSDEGLEIESFLSADEFANLNENYGTTQDQLVSKLESAVQKRLISDVPLGSFLSGGTDSSAIVALASRHHEKLSTFSIGYSDHPFFDETHFAELVAKKFGTNHTTFKLTNDDLLGDLENILDYIDEPFADSSAIPTYILSKHVREHVTVALSGDGADELFGGYYKHQALARALDPSMTDMLIKWSHPIISSLPQSRSGVFPNLVRRLSKFGGLQKLDLSERYWFLASLTNDPSHLLTSGISDSQIQDFKDSFISKNPTLTDYLKADQQIVLSGDMLTKVDLMSMANSLEVRVPFLDKDVVSFANNLPAAFKVNRKGRKRIVQDAFKEILPRELYERPKKGFEVPLLHWMQNELLTELDKVLFDEEYLENQGIFNTNQVLSLRTKLLSRNPGDVHGIIWALFVFQRWYKNHLDQ